MWNNKFNFQLVPKIYSCIWCDVTFKDPSFIRSHVRQRHRYHCNDCLKPMFSHADFIKHTLICNYSKEDIWYYEQLDILQKKAESEEAIINLT